MALKTLHVERMSMFLFLISVVTPEPEELEGEEKGVCGHSLQQELISVRS